MINCHGYILLPDDVEIKEYADKGGRGISFFFEAISDDNLDKEVAHKYPILLWCPADKADDTRTKLVPRSIWYISSGEWSMRKRANSTYPLPQLRVKLNDFRRFSTPIWHERNSRS